MEAQRTFYTNMHVIIEMESPVSLLVAALVFQFFAEKLEGEMCVKLRTWQTFGKSISIGETYVVTFRQIDVSIVIVVELSVK